VFNINFLSGMHGDNEISLQDGYDVIVISSLHSDTYKAVIYSDSYIHVIYSNTCSYRLSANETTVHSTVR